MEFMIFSFFYVILGLSIVFGIGALKAKHRYKTFTQASLICLVLCMSFIYFINK